MGVYRPLTLLCLAACHPACNPLDPFDTGFEPVEDALHYEAKQKHPVPTNVSELKIMSYNLKFAGGRIRFFFECNGKRSIMEESEVRHNLEGLAAKIRQYDPDILFLQEADIDSKRCAYINMVEWLLDHSDLNYAVYASQWKADYVPADGIGRVNSGNAILSRFPLTEAKRYALPMNGTQDALTRYFHLKRNYLKAKVELPGQGQLVVVNIHASAFADEANKKEQADALLAALKTLDQSGAKFVAGGDFNMLPPGTLVTKGFPDEACDLGAFDGSDYSAETEYMTELYNTFKPYVPLADYQANQGDGGPYFTFTGDERFIWNRTLDHLFTNGDFVEGSGLVHQNAARGGMETLLLSDHAPISVRYSINR